jgi:hypothetical protein
MKFVLGQEQKTIPLNEAEKLLDHSLNFDTIRPGLNTFGKGLMYYDYILRRHDNQAYFLQYRKEKKSLVVKASYTDLELERVKQNLLFMDQQSRIQIREMLRKEKWDLNLGEAIRGFYQTPVF